MNEILKKMHEVAASPRAQMDKYLAEGKKIVLCAPVYTPEEIIHSMGFVPMGAWGGDMELNREGVLSRVPVRHRPVPAGAGYHRGL